MQPIIQLNYLQRDFERALVSKLAFRAVAERITFPNGIGETLTKTRAGLKPARTTPLSPASNTNFDNGLTPTGFGVEQYTLTINQYGDTIDLNMVTNRVGIVEQFLQNAYVNGEQAGRSIDEIARNALFGGSTLVNGLNAGGYLGGNTRVRVTLGAAGAAVSVDDIRGFQITYLNGVGVPVSITNVLNVTVGANVYQVTGAAVDGTNVSTAPNGVSGVLTFSNPVSVADGTSPNAVVSALAPFIVRSGGRTTTASIQATDTVTIQNFLDAVARLRINNVPTLGGMYNCYVDPISMRQLFADPDWKQLFQGSTTENATYREGMAQNPLLGMRFIPTTEAFVQPHPSIANAFIRRPIVCGAGALIEGEFEGTAESDTARVLGDVQLIDGIAMITREPVDRLQQIIAQSWYWIGGYALPTDITTNPTTMGTATNAAFKRAIVIEHVG